NRPHALAVLLAGGEAEERCPGTDIPAPAVPVPTVASSLPPGSSPGSGASTPGPPGRAGPSPAENSEPAHACLNTPASANEPGAGVASSMGPRVPSLGSSAWARSL